MSYAFNTRTYGPQQIPYYQKHDMNLPGAPSILTGSYQSLLDYNKKKSAKTLNL